jgi:hypothetical protein
MRYNNISESISSSESDPELRAKNSAIARFARLQETTTNCALTLSRSVSRAVSPCPILRLNVRTALTIEQKQEWAASFQNLLPCQKMKMGKGGLKATNPACVRFRNNAT